MSESEQNQPRQLSFLLDTGPLSVLCGFPLNGTPYIQTVLQYTNIVLPDAVAIEIRGSGKLARIISPLLKRGKISTIATPANPSILDIAYSKGLGSGERATIKSALLSELPVVIDDRDAFVVACRFGLHPMGFQDFIVTLVNEAGLSKQTAIEIVKNTARQFPAMYLTHTLAILEE